MHVDGLLDYRFASVRPSVDMMTTMAIPILQLYCHNRSADLCCPKLDPFWLIGPKHNAHDTRKRDITNLVARVSSFAVAQKIGTPYVRVAGSVHLRRNAPKKYTRYLVLFFGSCPRHVVSVSVYLPQTHTS